MRPGFQRALADRLCSLLHAISPKEIRGWAEALRSEIANIPHDGEALRFVSGSLCGLLPRILLTNLQTTIIALAGGEHIDGGSTAMGFSLHRFSQLRLVGVISLIAAIGLGLAYMAAAGAPAAYLTLNLAALVLGLVMLGAILRLSPIARQWPGLGSFAMAIVLLATSLFGSAVEGAARWFVLGPLFIQTSLLFLPVMIVAFARTRNRLATSGICVAALALALQPDRAMAGALVAGLTVLAMYRLDRAVSVALASAALAFLVTLTRPDALSAVPFVEQILFSAFDIHWLAGAAVWLGAALLLVPAIAGWQGNADARKTAAVFGSVWLAIILAAVVGNYPTPVVGYGGSAIIGYLLCLCALPTSVERQSQTDTSLADRKVRDHRPGASRMRALSIVACL
jgi:cell division protein FtsW (lipid II flippase)